MFQCFQKYSLIKKPILIISSPACFLRSKFFNHTWPIKQHEKVFQQELLSRGIVPYPLVLSPFSTISWSLVRSKHEGVSLERQSTKSPHYGKGKTMLFTDKIARVRNIRQLVREIRHDCVKCLKQRDVTCGLQPGKAHLATVFRPSQHHTCIMIDLVPSLRLAAFKNQKTTRGA